MNISLTQELDNYVQQKVQSGMYHSASEVIREGLRLLKERDNIREAQLGQLRHDIETGIQQIEQGKFTDYESDDLKLLKDDIKSQSRNRMKQLSDE